MAITKNEFLVLTALLDGSVRTQRALANATGLSLGTVNSTCRSLSEKRLANGFDLAPAAIEELAPYKVRNAVIMAAGVSERFVPLTYEKPKGMLRVAGEVLIERQIRQLKAAGVDDITVVVGYMKESFFYLEDEFGVKIRINPYFAERSNNSTLMLMREQLGNTYICSSDDYFTENVFEPYVYRSYYATTFFEGETSEYCVSCGSGNRITGVSIGGHDAWGMLGHAYFDQEFAQAFVDILISEYDRPETAPKLWEDIYIDHIKELDMVKREYADGIIYEFDSLEELRSFDPQFIENVDSQILDNICQALGCQRGAIRNVEPLRKGISNFSFRFEVDAQTYVYRHPGPGTDEFVNRRSEAFSQEIALRLGIDGTFVCEDPDAGWKIARYVPDCAALDYRNPDQVRKAMAMARALHGCGETSSWTLDVFEQAKKLLGLLGKRSYPLFPDLALLEETADELHAFVEADAVGLCLCHNDMYDANYLVRGDEMDLIDWEYSAMSDYASDLGTFICCSDYAFDEAREAIAYYFEREPSAEELRHCWAYVSLCSYYWFTWALYKEASGDSVGEWLYLWYRTAKRYGARAIEMYAC